MQVFSTRTISYFSMYVRMMWQLIKILYKGTPADTICAYILYINTNFYYKKIVKAFEVFYFSFLFSSIMYDEKPIYYFPTALELNQKLTSSILFFLYVLPLFHLLLFHQLFLFLVFFSRFDSSTFIFILI